MSESLNYKAIAEYLSACTLMDHLWKLGADSASETVAHYQDELYDGLSKEAVEWLRAVTERQIKEFGISKILSLRKLD